MPPTRHKRRVRGRNRRRIEGTAGSVRRLCHHAHGGRPGWVSQARGRRGPGSAARGPRAATAARAPATVARRRAARPRGPADYPRTRRSRTISSMTRSWPRSSASAATTSSGRPLPSCGSKRVRTRRTTGGPRHHLDRVEQRPKVVAHDRPALVTAAEQAARRRSPARRPRAPRRPPRQRPARSGSRPRRAPPPAPAHRARRPRSREATSPGSTAAARASLVRQMGHRSARTTSMSSASAVIPTWSGAANATGDFGLAPAPRASGSPAASSEASHASLSSRPASRGASGPRASVSRQRCRGSRIAAGAGSGRGSTSGSLPHDGRPRPSRFDPSDGGAAGGPDRRDDGRPPAASLPPAGRGRQPTPIRAGLAARRGPAGRRPGPRPGPVDGPRQRPPVHRRTAAGLSARRSRPSAVAPRRSTPARDPHRLHHRGRALRGLHGHHADPADQRDPPLRRRLPAPGRAAEHADQGAVRLLLAPPDPAGDPRVDRFPHRGPAERAARRRAQSRAPAPPHHGGGQPHRRDLRLHHPAGLGRSTS